MTHVPHKRLKRYCRCGWLLFGCLWILGCRNGKNPDTASERAACGNLHLVSGESVNLGEGDVGDELTGEIRVENRGSGVLNINNIDVGCACSSVQPERWSLNPNEQMAIKVSGRVRNDSTSRTAFEVKISSNDAYAPVASVKVTFAVRLPEITFEPDHVDFGDICANASPVRRVRILDRNAKAWQRAKLLEVMSDAGLADITVRSIDSGEADAQVLDLVLKPASLLPGLFSDVVRVCPQGDNRHAAKIAIIGRVLPLVDVSPSIVIFAAEKGGVNKRELVLRRNDGKPIGKIIGIECPPFLTSEDISDKVDPNCEIRRVRLMYEAAKPRTDYIREEVLIKLEGVVESIKVGIVVPQ